MPHPQPALLQHLLQRRAVGEAMAAAEAVVLRPRMFPNNQGLRHLRVHQEEMANDLHSFASTTSTAFVEERHADTVMIAPSRMAPRTLMLNTVT